MIGVEGVAEEQLPGVRAVGPLGDLQLDVVTFLGRAAALGLHGQYVAFYVELDRLGRAPE